MLEVREELGREGKEGGSWRLEGWREQVGEEVWLCRKAAGSGRRRKSRTTHLPSTALKQRRQKQHYELTAR